METNNHEDQWVSSRLAALTPEWNADLARGRVLWADKSHAPRHSSKWIISATVTAGICIAALLLPQTRAKFREILAADYSVDTSFKKIERAAFYGKTGVLTMKGFIDGKPGLPHFNYAAVVCEKFLGYVFEVPANIDGQA